MKNASTKEKIVIAVAAIIVNGKTDFLSIM